MPMTCSSWMSTARLRELVTPTTIAYEDTVVCDEELTPKYRISSRLSGDVAAACLLGEFDTCHVSMLFPRTVIDRAGPWDTRLRVRQDFDFTLRCLEHAAVVPGNGTATFYRRHDASATRSEHAVRDAQLSSRLVLEGYFQRHPDLKDSSLAEMRGAGSTGPKRGLRCTKDTSPRRCGLPFRCSALPPKRQQDCTCGWPDPLSRSVVQPLLEPWPAHDGARGAQLTHRDRAERPLLQQFEQPVEQLGLVLWRRWRRVRDPRRAVV